MAYTPGSALHASDFDSDLALEFEYTPEHLEWAADQQQREHEQSEEGSAPLPHHLVFDQTLTESYMNRHTLSDACVALPNPGRNSAIVQYVAGDQDWSPEDFSVPSGPTLQPAMYVSCFLPSPVFSRLTLCRAGPATTLPLTRRQMRRTPSHATSPSGTASRQRPSSAEADAVHKICSVSCLSGTDDMFFECKMHRCRRRYSRWPDFMRHYNGSHAIKKKTFWCPLADCPRNKATGDKPFPRKDKVMDHVRQAHGLHPGRRSV
jgi:hypothetical protein